MIKIKTVSDIKEEVKNLAEEYKFLISEEKCDMHNTVLNIFSGKDYLQLGVVLIISQDTRDVKTEFLLEVGNRFFCRLMDTKLEEGKFMGKDSITIKDDEKFPGANWSISEVRELAKSEKTLFGPTIGDETIIFLPDSYKKLIEFIDSLKAHISVPVFYHQ